MPRTILAIALILSLTPRAARAQDAQDKPAAPPATPAQPPQSAPATPVDLFARDTFRIDPLVCPFKGQIGYKPGEVECGLLQVPENREDPSSRFIELHYFKINANPNGKQTKQAEQGLKPGKRADPVVYLGGGPGAKATAYVKRLKEHGLVKHRDLYFLEQRGIGTSAEFCRFYHTRKPAAADAKTFKAALEADHTDLIDCAKNAARAGVDLRGYNSIENARDVKALRRALKIKTWNVWGISYGSILGQAYLKQDAAGVRAIVLDGVVPLDARNEEQAWRTPHFYHRSLKKLDKLCQAQPDCAERYPDLVQRIRRAITSVKGKPIVVAVKETERFPSGKPRIFRSAVGYLPFVLLYEQSNYPGLPGLIYAWADAVERREGAQFKALALMEHNFFSGMSYGMHRAVLCLDGDSERQAASIKLDTAEHPILGAAFGSVESFQRGARLCHQLGMPPRDSGEYAPVKTDIPALIVAGDMDPITPPPLAKIVLPGFSKGTYVLFPHTGHGPSRSVKCAGTMLTKFFDAPRAKPDLSCVSEVKPPDFHVPLFETSAVARLAAMALEDKKSLAGPGAQAGLLLLVSLIALLVLTFAPVVRRIDRRKPAQSAWARLAAWLAAALSVASGAILGGAIAATIASSELLLLFGLVPWARFGAVAGLLAGLAGLATLVLTTRARLKHKLPVSTLIGFVITGLAAVGLSVLLSCWDLGLF